MRHRIRSIALLILGLAFEGASTAQESAPQLPPFDVSAGIVAGLRIRPAEWDPQSLEDQLTEIDPQAASNWRFALTPFTSVRDVLVGAEVRELTVLLTIGGLPGNPLVIVLSEHDEAAASGLVSALRNSIGGVWETRNYQGTVLISTAANLKRLTIECLDPHLSLATASAEHSETSLQFYLAPSDLQRRAIRELMPTLPTELGGGPSATLLDGVLWGSLGLTAGETGSFDLVIQSQDAVAAARLAAWVRERRPELDTRMFGAEAAAVLEPLTALLPEVSGDRLVRSANWDDPELSAMVSALAPWIDSVSDDMIAAQNLAKMKRQILQMHNYFNTFRRFPGYGSADADGKSLLSWRVQILPYLGHLELYERFHLDEPWDSEHNRQLIAEMPKVYAAVGSRFAQQEGMTNFRVPGGPASMFPDLAGISFSEVTDGSSNTLAILEVDDDHAVIWTRPESFEVDAQNPLIGLGGHSRDRWSYARADGSVTSEPMDFPADRLRALLTRNGSD